MRDSLEAGWSFTGTERISKVSTGSMKEIVYFYAHPQLPPEYPKKIVVRKINTEGNENVITHPQFDEVSDRFQIVCYYKIDGTDEVLFDQAEADVEDMCEEVVRIFKTVYNPLNGTGTFYRSSRNWENNDDLQKQMLVRSIVVTISKLQAQNSEVFIGYTGVLTFDLSLSSNMDSAPAGDYVYTEVNGIVLQEGFSVIPYLTKDTGNGKGVPLLSRNRFGGTFRANMFAKRTDHGATAEKLDKIYKMQANGQFIEAALFQANPNTEGSVKTLTTTTVILVTSMRKTTDTEILVSYDIEGAVVKPSTVVVA